MSKRMNLALAIVLVVTLAGGAWASASASEGSKLLFVAYYPVHAVPVFDPVCGCIQQTFTPGGDGHATQLGTSGITGLAHAWRGETILQKGDGTLTAANGDSISIYYEGEGNVIDQGQHIVVEGWYKVTGGTGQFENAAGKGKYAVFVYTSGEKPNDLWFTGYLRVP